MRFRRVRLVSSTGQRSTQQAVDAYAGHSSTGRAPRWKRSSVPPICLPTTSVVARRRPFRGGGADTALDAPFASIPPASDRRSGEARRQQTMAWGREGRVPFLDHELVELAAACPPELKLAHAARASENAARALLRPRSSTGRRVLPGPGFVTWRVRCCRAFVTLTSRSARERGSFARYIKRALETPNERSNLGVNILWQLGCWTVAPGLSTNVTGDGCHCSTQNETRPAKEQADAAVVGKPRSHRTSVGLTGRPLSAAYSRSSRDSPVARVVRVLPPDPGNRPWARSDSSAALRRRSDAEQCRTIRGPDGQPDALTYW